MKISGTKERQRLVGSCEGGKGRGSYLTFFALGPTRRQEGSCYPENRLHRYCSFVYRYRVHFCRHREEGIRRHLGGGGLDKKPRKKGRDTRYNFERNPFARVYICARIDKPTKGHLSFLFVPAPIFASCTLFFVQLQEGIAIFEEHARIRIARIYFARFTTRSVLEERKFVRSGDRRSFRCSVISWFDDHHDIVDFLFQAAFLYHYTPYKYIYICTRFSRDLPLLSLWNRRSF